MAPRRCLHSAITSTLPRACRVVIAAAERSCRAVLEWVPGSRSQKGPRSNEHHSLLSLVFAQHQPLSLMSRAAFPHPEKKKPKQNKTFLHLQHGPAAYTSSWSVYLKQHWAGAGIKCRHRQQLPLEIGAPSWVRR